MAPIAPNLSEVQSVAFFGFAQQFLHETAVSVASTKPTEPAYPPVLLETGDNQALKSDRPNFMPSVAKLFVDQTPGADDGVRIVNEGIPPLSEFHKISVGQLLALKPEELQEFADQYHKARLADDLKSVLWWFPKETELPLHDVLSAFPEEISAPLWPLAEDRNMTITLTRDTENMKDALTGAALFGTYRLVIKHRGVITDTIRTAPQFIKTGTVNIIKNPSIPVVAIKIAGMGLLYIALDQYLAAKGVPDYARGPAVLGLQVGGILGLDAAISIAAGQPMPWQNYAATAKVMPGYYLTYKGASYVFNEMGLDYNNAGNMLASFTVSAVATKPTLKGLGWATQHAILGLHSLGSKVTLGAASVGVGRSFVPRLIPAAIALVGKAIGSGLLAGAAKFLGKAKNIVNPLAWGLLAMDIYYGVKDGMSEGEQLELNFARDSLLAERHWGVTNFFLGSAFKAAIDDSDVTAQRNKIKGELADYVAGFEEDLLAATLEYTESNSVYDRKKFAAHLSHYLSKKNDTDSVSGLKLALETFTSVGEARSMILRALTDDGRFDGSVLADHMMQKVRTDLVIAEKEYRAGLSQNQLMAFNEAGDAVSVSKAKIGDLSWDARHYLLGVSGNRLSPHAFNRARLDTYNALNQAMNPELASVTK